ncbi:MAG: hypothetical protein AAGF88_05675 [Pseudomonadota bacterium]
MRKTLCALVTPVIGAVAALSQATAQATPPEPPAADLAMPYYDRHRIDISNLRYFYEGSLMAEAMLHGPGMFSEIDKWRLALFQMILSESGHFQARTAYQLAYLGVPIPEILAVWSPGFVDEIDDPRLQAAFRYVEAAGTLPTRVTADTHAMLRQHFIDRQIAELIEVTSYNASNALHDNILPIPTDPALLEWASENLAAVGWTPGHNASQSPEEQRAAAFAGPLIARARAEILEAWERDDVTAEDPSFASDWIEILTGYDVPRVIFDADADGVEDPFDQFPLDDARWADPDRSERNLPDPSTPAFDAAAYAFDYFQPGPVPETNYPLSDRIYFDTEWTRQDAMGTSRIEGYFAAGDRALPAKLMWQVFIVYQLTSGCIHCQVHGSYSLLAYIEDDFPDGVIPAAERDTAMRQLYDLFDFEQSDLFTEAERAAFRFARDAGTLPTRTTAAHIEALRRHFADREIQELMMTLLAAGRLSVGQQSNITVTDRLSMAWALRNLTQTGWHPGGHLGLPQEQRRYFMSEVGAAGAAAFFSGEEFDFASEWVGITVPLAIDRDGDGVDDTFDGFPDDPARWEDTDRDGLEDAVDSDIDGDGLSNTLEEEAGTFPYKADSDGDGIIDPFELRDGTDPVDPRSL